MTNEHEQPDSEPVRAEWKARLEASPLARAAVFPYRARAAFRHDSHVLAESASWLFRSREHTNYTYDLTDLNWEHLAWWVAAVGKCDVALARELIREARDDKGLVDHVQGLTERSEFWRLADRQVLLGRRVGWYALVRIRRPELVVETGTDKGLGTVTLAQAIRRNGRGRVVTMDINPAAGYLLEGYEDVVTLEVGDSVAGLARSADPVDLFIHDSSHTREHEEAEFVAVAPRLAPGALVLSDNSHVTDALPQWADQRGWQFLFFGERPADHWYPGAGIGAAWEDR